MFFNNKILEIGIHIIKMIMMQEAEDIAMNTRGVKIIEYTYKIGLSIFWTGGLFIQPHE